MSSKTIKSSVKGLVTPFMFRLLVEVLIIIPLLLLVGFGKQVINLSLEPSCFFIGEDRIAVYRKRESFFISFQK